MAERCSCLDVARAAGVSPATVSLVLNDRRHVAIPEPTRERVREAAKKLGYRPNRLASSLLRGRTQTVGVVLPSLASSYVANLAEGIQAAAWDRDHRVLLAHTRYEPDVEARQLDLLLDHQVDGVIIITGERTIGDLPRRLDTLARAGVPCVVADEASVAERVDCVVSDDLAGARQAVTHLIELGHKRIAHLGAGQLTSSARDRLAGYRAALAEAGLPCQRCWIAGERYLDGDPAGVMRQLLASASPPTAVFAANDRLLAESLPMLRSLSLRIPEDLALVGYADYDFAAYLGFTTVDQQPREMGRQALLRLLERIADPSLKPLVHRLAPRLVVRSSSGARPLPAEAHPPTATPNA